MGLVIHLRHALGERMLEVPERGVEAPLIVGRAGHADVQIPSISVALEHLVIFRHEQRWVVQNSPDGTGTLINGEPLRGVQGLVNGDVLALGPDENPPTVEIQSTGEADIAAAVPTIAEVQPEDWSHGEPGAEQGDWIPTPSSLPISNLKRRKNSPDAGTAFAMISAVVAVAGVGIYVYVNRDVGTPKPAAPVAAATMPAAVEEPEAEETVTRPSLRSIFSESPDEEAADKPSTPGPPVTKPAVAAATKPATPSVDPTLARAFKVVENAYYDPNLARPLLAYDTFVREHPTAYRPQIERYRADTLDKLWWNRIDSLIEKRNTLSAAVRITESDLKDGSETDAYKKTVLTPRLADQKQRLATHTTRLTKEMGYTATTPPPFGDDAAMKALRAKRDPMIYDAWCKQVLKHVHDTNGRFPWADEK